MGVGVGVAFFCCLSWHSAAFLPSSWTDLPGDFHTAVFSTSRAVVPSGLLVWARIRVEVCDAKN